MTPDGPVEFNRCAGNGLVLRIGDSARDAFGSHSQTICEQKQQNGFSEWSLPGIRSTKCQVVTLPQMCYGFQ